MLAVLEQHPNDSLYLSRGDKGLELVGFWHQCHSLIPQWQFSDTVQGASHRLGEDVIYDLLRLRRCDDREEDVLEGFWIDVVFRASTVPVQKGHVRLVREWWRDGAELLVQVMQIDPVLGGVRHADNKACLFRIRDETKSRLTANRLWRKSSVCCYCIATSYQTLTYLSRLANIHPLKRMFIKGVFVLAFRSRLVGYSQASQCSSESRMFIEILP